MKTVHVVVTTVNDGEQDVFPDVVLITEDENKALKLTEELKNRTVSLKWLAPYDSAATFTRVIDEYHLG